MVLIGAGLILLGLNIADREQPFPFISVETAPLRRAIKREDLQFEMKKSSPRNIL
jgi:hypothetical protein